MLLVLLVGGSGESLWEIDPNSSNIIQPKEKRIITSNNTRIVDIEDHPTQPQDAVNKRYIDKQLEETEAKFPIAFAINVVSQVVPNLETTNKTVAGTINEIFKKQPQPTPIPPSSSNWKEVGTKVNKRYRIYYNHEWQISNTNFSFICKEFIYGQLTTETKTLYWDKVNDRIMVSLQMSKDTIFVISDPVKYGQLLKLEELQE